MTTYPDGSTLTASVSQHERKLLAKSYDLFAKRGVVGLARTCLAPEEYKQWMERALSLQLRIYGLDLYYEGRATLRATEERPLWQGVEGELRRERRANDGLLWSSYADLQQYADVETRIHEFDVIDPREFAHIALLKCSDVRMARGLIWAFSSPAHPRMLHYWELYDQCWELVEDVLDIGEDGSDWNFNFWLYSFMAGKDAMAGIIAARDTLRRKVSQLEDAYRRLPIELSRVVASSYDSTLLAATLAQQCQRRVFAAILKGHVLQFGDQVEIAVRAA